MGVRLRDFVAAPIDSWVIALVSLLSENVETGFFLIQPDCDFNPKYSEMIDMIVIGIWTKLCLERQEKKKALVKMN